MERVVVCLIRKLLPQKIVGSLLIVLHVEIVD
jgi:hypothetical protein